MGTCEYCGQVLAGAETNEEATAECQCFEAVNARKRARAAEDAKQIVDDLFGSGAEARKLVPLGEGVVRALCSLVDLIGRGDVQKVTVALPGVCTVRISINGYKITVERIEGRKYSNVAGEQ